MYPIKYSHKRPPQQPGTIISTPTEIQYVRGWNDWRGQTGWTRDDAEIQKIGWVLVEAPPALQLQQAEARAAALHEALSIFAEMPQVHDPECVFARQEDRLRQCTCAISQALAIEPGEALKRIRLGEYNRALGEAARVLDRRREALQEASFSTVHTVWAAGALGKAAEEIRGMMGPVASAEVVESVCGESPDPGKPRGSA